MIRQDTLDKAIFEAQSFLSAAAALKGENTKAGRWTKIVEHAACKRASMELTRVLADLRQSR
jgi:hypothetical protein